MVAGTHCPEGHLPISQQPKGNVFGVEFRDYSLQVTERQKEVEKFYRENHEKQTMEYLQQQVYY